jgi:CRISPR-associated exonuclease Cas4
MIYDDDNLLMISALQHLLYCERQCALIHVEQLWSENVLTVRGEIMHKRAHDNEISYHKGIRVERGISVRSRRLGLIGKSDVVEFHKKNERDIPFPIEYKLGKPKKNRCDEVQLCAQAICLEEMLNVTIPNGALFYGKTQRRQDVSFDTELRMLTESTAIQLHELVNKEVTPPPIYEKWKCDNCSLLDLCMPKSSKKIAATIYLEKIIHEETA